MYAELLPTQSSSFQKFHPRVIKKLYQGNKLSKFKQKIRFSMDIGKFQIKTAESPEDLLKALKLRHTVFIKEGLGLECNKGHEVDFDRYDLIADHILLIDKQTDIIIGTYRVLSSGFCNSFYSGREFHLGDFFKSSGLKLELGRACIDKNYRKSIAIHLIWKGLGRYASLIGAQKLFGCTSIKNESKFLAQQILNYLKPESHSTQYNVLPRLKYQSFREEPFYSLLTLKDIERIIPPLMKSYINAGAKFYGRPAYDPVLRTTDFFTVLDLTKLNEQYKKRYTQL